MAHRAAIALLTVAASGCGGFHPALPRDLAYELVDSAAPVRITVERDHISSWAVSRGIDRMPPRVQRAIRALLPDQAGSEVGFSGKAWLASGGILYLAERTYSDGQHRAVWTYEDGAIARRSHSIPLSEAPAAVATAIEDAMPIAPIRLDYWQEIGDGYTAVFDLGGGQRTSLEFDADGVKRGSTVYHEAEVRASH
jgi:hypothetical protein